VFIVCHTHTHTELLTHLATHTHTHIHTHKMRQAVMLPTFWGEIRMKQRIGPKLSEKGMKV